MVHNSFRSDSDEYCPDGLHWSFYEQFGNCDEPIEDLRDWTEDDDFIFGVKDVPEPVKYVPRWVPEPVYARLRVRSRYYNTVS